MVTRSTTMKNINSQKCQIQAQISNKHYWMLTSFMVATIQSCVLLIWAWIWYFMQQDLFKFYIPDLGRSNCKGFRTRAHGDQWTRILWARLQATRYSCYNLKFLFSSLRGLKHSAGQVRPDRLRSCCNILSAEVNVLKEGKQQSEQAGTSQH